MILILVACTYNVTKIDEEIPNDVYSAFHLFPIVNNHIEEYLDDNEYHLGQVRMKLNENHRGDVEFTFVQEESKIIYIRLDTRNNKVEEIVRHSYADKLDPGIINMKKWQIDSVDAVQIAEGVFNDTEGFEYSHLIINTPNSNGEYWFVSLRDRDTNIYYDCKIDVMTGEVVFTNIRK